MEQIKIKNRDKLQKSDFDFETFKGRKFSYNTEI